MNHLESFVYKEVQFQMIHSCIYL